MSHSLCVMGVYDEVKMTVPMVVRYVHSDKTKKNVTLFRVNTHVLTTTGIGETLAYCRASRAECEPSP
jgi:hypothetical protein